MQIRATSYMGMHSASFTSQVDTKIRLLSVLRMYWILVLVECICKHNCVSNYKTLYKSMGIHGSVVERSPQDR